MTRRGWLAGAGAWMASAAAQSSKGSPNLGGAPAGFPVRTRLARSGGAPFDFVTYCHRLGLGVVETRIAPADSTDLRRKVDSFGMRVILDTPLPKSESDLPAYDAAVKAAKEAGAISMHAAMTQRRYEQFESLSQFRQDFERCKHTIELAEPVLRKHRMRLGIENHKGWRSAEQAAWLKHVSSEWVGVHFDYGNNLSLCEDPADTLRNLLPFVFASHLKDMAVAPYEDGFLLSEVPLGQGFLNLAEMTATLRKKDPAMPFDLEMITRDPLKIPVLTQRYWNTFDDAYSPLPGRDLARVLELVKKNNPKAALPYTTGMTPEAQLKLEDDNISTSIAYAREHLAL